MTEPASGLPGVARIPEPGSRTSAAAKFGDEGELSGVTDEASKKKARRNSLLSACSRRASRT